ncbi:MAG: Copper amine oxidase-like domain-containing protein, partial [Desulfotomaculum sp. 46_80]
SSFLVSSRLLIIAYRSFWGLSNPVLGGQMSLFIDQNDQSIQRFDTYSLVESFSEEVLSKYPKALLYDESAKQWYLWKDTASQSVDQIIDTARKNGFLEVISNTVV